MKIKSGYSQLSNQIAWPASLWIVANDSPKDSLHSFRTKLKSHFFTVDWFFFPLFIHVLYFCSFFRRAPQRDVY